MGVAVVTGANRGLGAEWVHQLLEGGWEVYASYRTEIGRLSTFDNPNLTIHQLDVQSNSSVEMFAKNAPSQIDLLINNAGVADGRWRNLTEIDDVWALEVIDINALGPVRVVKALYEKMNHDSLTKIGMVSSLMASIDDCHMGRSYAYRASKTALNMFAMSMKNELQSIGSSILILHPGWVETDMGGPNAPLSVKQSVDGIMQRISEQTLTHSGRFVQFDGTPVEW